MRTEDVMSHFFKRKKGPASGLLKITYKEKAKGMSEIYTLNCKKQKKTYIGTINLT